MDTFVGSTRLLKVSEMAENLIGSEIIKLAWEIRKRVEQGEEIYNYTIGDFDPNIFPIPNSLKNHIIDAYKNDITNYPQANGMSALRSSVSRFLHTRGGLEYNENQILISSGARPLLYTTYQTLLDPGDTVLIPVPSWNNNHYAHIHRVNPVFIETKPQNNFLPTADDFKPHISEASLIALCSPLNPSGTIFERTQLERICELIVEENKKRGEYNKPIYLLFDQIYWMLMHSGNLHFDPVSLVPEMKNYTIYIDGISKAFASTGLRVGWGFGPQKVIDKMRALLSHIGAWAPKPVQMAVSKFLLEDEQVDEYLIQFRAEIFQRLQEFYKGFQDLKSEGFKVNAIEPQASIYLTVELNLLGMTTPEGEKLSNGKDITDYMLKEAHLALVPFQAFGTNNNQSWFRLSVGTSELDQIPQVFKNLREALERLN